MCAYDHARVKVARRLKRIAAETTGAASLCVFAARAALAGVVRVKALAAVLDPRDWVPRPR